MAEYMIVPKDSIDDTADAIKTKLGTQNDLTWGQDGFASYVENIPSGGSGIDSGSFTPATNGRSFSVTVSAGVTNFVLYTTDYNAGIVDAGWFTVGGTWFNGIARCYIRYNNANFADSSASCLLSGTTLTFTAGYNLRTEKTYLWFAWQEARNEILQTN